MTMLDLACPCGATSTTIEDSPALAGFSLDCSHCGGAATHGDVGTTIRDFIREMQAPGRRSLMHAVPNV